MTIFDIISISLIGAFILPFVLFFITRNIFFFTIGIITIIADLSTKIIKRFTSKLSPRPKGACACDILCLGGDVTGKPGFPSGHATVSTFVAITLSWYYQEYNVWPIGLAYVLLTAAARICKKCHSVIQVIAGIFYGTILAMLFIYIYRKFQSNPYKETTHA